MNLDIVVNSILNRIKEAVGFSLKKGSIPLHEPDLRNSNAQNYLNDCVKNNWVSSCGEYVNRFEQRLCEFTDSNILLQLRMVQML